MATESYILYPSKLKMNNPKGSALTNAEWVAGHHSVGTLEELYEIYDFILSPSTYEGYASDGSDAIGELWYVRSEKTFYQLLDWENRKSSTGWAKSNIKSASASGDSSDSNVNSTGDKTNFLTSITIAGDGSLSSTSYNIADLQASITASYNLASASYTYASNIGDKFDVAYAYQNKYNTDSYTSVYNTIAATYSYTSNIGNKFDIAYAYQNNYNTTSYESLYNTLEVTYKNAISYIQNVIDDPNSGLSADIEKKIKDAYSYIDNLGHSYDAFYSYQTNFNVTSYNTLDERIKDTYSYVANAYQQGFTDLKNYVDSKMSDSSDTSSTYMDDIYDKLASIPGNVKSIDKVEYNTTYANVTYTTQSPTSAKFNESMTWQSTSSYFQIEAATEEKAGLMTSTYVGWLNSIIEGDKPLASISIASGAWTITPTTTAFSTSNKTSLTVDYGYTVSWTGTWKWTASSSQKVPEKYSGSWGSVNPGNGVESTSITKTGMTSNQTVATQTIAAAKRGLVVNGSKVTFGSSSDDTASCSVGLSFQYMKFAGYCTTQSPSSSEILSGKFQYRGTSKGTNVTGLSPAESEYVFFAYPATMGDISSAKLGGVEEVIGAWTKISDVTVTMPVSNYQIKYRVYVSTKQGAYKNQSVQFS